MSDEQDRFTGAVIDIHVSWPAIGGPEEVHVSTVLSPEELAHSPSSSAPDPVEQAILKAVDTVFESYRESKRRPVEGT